MDGVRTTDSVESLCRARGPSARYPTPLRSEEPVKSSLGRQALISTHEWDEAARLGERYAILGVTRDRSGDPTGMDLLVDPVALHHEQRLIRTADGYVVTYGVSAG